MDLLRWILFGVLPAVAAIGVFVGAGGPRFLALALAVALGVPFALVHGWCGWPVDISLAHGDPRAWWFWCIVAAGVVGVFYDTRLLWRPLLVAGDATLVVALPWLVSAPLRERLGMVAYLSWLLAAWLGIGLQWWVLRRVAKVHPGPAVPLAGTIALAVDAWLLRSLERGLEWQLAGVGAVACGMAVATTLWRRPFVCGSGGTLAVVVGHAGLLLCGESGEVPRAPMIVAFLVPAALGVALSRIFRKSPATGVAAGLLATALAAGAVVTLVLAHA